MHSLDTVKTRQQGDPHIPPKYTTMFRSYGTILQQEGIRRGLYGGWLPAMLGSFPGTVIFFGTYEYSKRHMIDAGITPQFAYLTSGMYPQDQGPTYLPSTWLILIQAFSQISRHHSFTFLPKFSKLDSNFKGGTIIPFSNQVTTTVPFLMQHEPLLDRKASLLYFMATKRPFFEISPFQHCSSHFTSKDKPGRGNGNRVGRSVYHSSS